MSESQVFYFSGSGTARRAGARRSKTLRGPLDFEHPRSFKASKQAFCVCRDSTGIVGMRFMEIRPLDLPFVCPIRL